MLNNCLLSEGSCDIIGETQAVQNLRQILERVASTNSRVLITGQAGTGKDHVARYIHRSSDRSDAPFIALNCANLNPERLELELFGSIGGITGAPPQTGVLEQANGGTLLLDEVADMPLETQGKIVRVLQEQSFSKVGSDEPIDVDVRIIASTSRDLEKGIEEGDFRQDLYYRLNVVPIHIPPLREYRKDISLLADYFAQAFSAQSGLQKKEFSDGAIQALQSYEWPGNVRQLRNVIEWVMIMNNNAESDRFERTDLPPDILEILPTLPANVNDEEILSLNLRDAREAFERDYLLSQIDRFDGNISKTAQFVGMERSALHRKMKSLQIAGNEKGVNTTTDNQKQKRA